MDRSGMDLGDISGYELDEYALNSMPSDKDLIPLLFQCGFLTIKGHDRMFGLYELDFPNKAAEAAVTSRKVSHVTEVNV